MRQPITLLENQHVTHSASSQPVGRDQPGHATPLYEVSAPDHQSGNFKISG